MCFLLTNYVTN